MKKVTHQIYIIIILALMVLSSGLYLKATATQYNVGEDEYWQGYSDGYQAAEQIYLESSAE